MHTTFSMYYFVQPSARSALSPGARAESLKLVRTSGVFLGRAPHTDVVCARASLYMPPRKASKKTAPKASAAPKPATADDTPPPMRDGWVAVLYNTRKSYEPPRAALPATARRVRCCYNSRTWYEKTRAAAP